MKVAIDLIEENTSVPSRTRTISIDSIKAQLIEAFFNDAQTSDNLWATLN